ncbi:beta-galactosidase [Sphingobacterium sp. Ag1]|uniref:glycoside hydrolase family 2 TIM barrel-domain containing protein n=1 Tax=Sphingobacterium sp. Ag1 TaxID=1643451 RepID=UPI000627DA7E|nr:glycoside hydrolase family 2 TIM barrel-domain containing protein [Sphingobacterium sp. Ag1]KKO89715.1 beta-galactosidase [Sphingobacterium sp. Ag1]
MELCKFKLSKGSWLALLLACSSLGNLSAQQAGPFLTPMPDQLATSKTSRILLNGQWNFRAANTKPVAIQVPGEWEMQGQHVAAGETAVYERLFDVPDDWEGNPVYIRFDGVSSHALVKVNDQVVGEHEGGFVAFQVDLTGKVNKGKNKLTVEIQANTISDILSCVSQYAVHTVGGILRKATLFTVPKVHISDAVVATDFDSKYVHAALKLAGLVQNSSNQQQQVQLHYVLRDADGKTVLEKSSDKIQLGVGSHKQIESLLAVKKPMHWSAETPYLYVLETALIADGKAIQTNKQKVGFREIEVVKNQLMVNGKPVKLRGVNRHAVHPLNGRASDPAIDRQDVVLFKQANVNYIRTSHYPPSEEFLNAADELGMYVESEAALSWIQHGASPIWRKWDYKDKRFLPVMLGANIDNVLSNRNHPSILFWSLGNESHWSPLWAEVNTRVKALDPTRPTSFHDQTWGGFNNGGSKADIANYHYPGIDGPAATDTMKRPTLFGEYAHLSTYNRRELLTDPGIRDAYNAPLVTFVDAIYKHSANLGGAIWSGIDDTFHLPDGRIVGYGPWGPIDGWRRPKPEYFGMKKAYSPVRIGTPQLKNGKVVVNIENRYDFLSLDQLKLVAIVDGKEVPFRAAIGPRTSSEVVLPIQADYGSLRIIAMDNQQNEVENELFEKVAKNQEKFSATELQLKQDSAYIYVKQGNVNYTFSRTYGKLLAVRKDGELILTKGPALALIEANAEDGGKPNVAGETYQNNIAPLKQYEQYTLFADAAEASQTGDSISVHFDLRYQQGTGKQKFVFLKNGLLRVEYEMVYQQGQEMNLYQAGLMLELPLSYDKLAWSRNGSFSTYPANHIGRNEGEAVLYALPLYEVEEHGKPQAKDWKDDANILGSNDFRSTKGNIYWASLHSPAAAVKVLSNGQQHARAWKQDQHIQWLIADYSNNGSEPFYGSPHSYGRKKLKKGDKLSGQIILKIN